MQFSAPVKKHWLGSFSIVLPPSVVRDRWEQAPPGSRGPGRGGGIPWGGGGGDGGPAPESMYACMYVCMYVTVCIYILYTIIQL